MINLYDTRVLEQYNGYKERINTERKEEKPLNKIILKKGVAQIEKKPLKRQETECVEKIKPKIKIKQSENMDFYIKLAMKIIKSKQRKLEVQKAVSQMEIK